MTIGESVKKIRRVEFGKAVKYDLADTSAIQVIRGWLGITVDQSIPIPPGAWVVKRDMDDQKYIVPEDDFNAEFEIVEDEQTGEPDPEPGAPAGPIPNTED